MTRGKINGAHFLPDETVKRIRENKSLSKKSMETADHFIDLKRGHYSHSDDEFIEWFETDKTVWKILE